MQIPSVDYVAVLVGAVVYYALGAIWYQPPVFGRAWMKAIGKDETDIKNASGGAAMATSMIGMAILCLVSVTALAWLISWANADNDAIGITDAIGAALVVALGFHLTAWGTTVLFDGRPWAYLAINYGYHLVGLVLASVVIAVWP